MKMRVLLDFPPGPNRVVFSGAVDWVFVVRHEFWIFTWDHTYSRIKVPSNAYQWQNEDGRPVNQQVFNFLNSQLDIRSDRGRA